MKHTNTLILLFIIAFLNTINILFSPTKLLVIVGLSLQKTAMKTVDFRRFNSIRIITFDEV